MAFVLTSSVIIRYFDILRRLKTGVKERSHYVSPSEWRYWRTIQSDFLDGLTLCIRYFRYIYEISKRFSSKRQPCHAKDFKDQTKHYYLLIYCQGDTYYRPEKKIVLPYNFTGTVTLVSYFLLRRAYFSLGNDEKFTESRQYLSKCLNFSSMPKNVHY